jgi:hypothetical protein
MDPGAERPRPEQNTTDWMSRLGDGAEAGEVSAELLVALKVGLGLVLAAVLVWILWRAVSRLGRLWTEDDVEELRDSVWLWPGWRAVWRWILSRLNPVRERAFVAVASLRGAPREERSARGFYRELLRLGVRTGHPRQLSETVLEYEARLARVVPGGEPDLRTISDAYVHARYGPPSSEPDPSALSSALARLRLLLEGTVKGA